MSAVLPRSTIGDVVAIMALHEDFYDAELRRHNEHFRAAVRVGPRDRVLDIGCGTGQTTREAARAAVDGHVVGVDVSGPMLERARTLSEADGLPNITFLLGDAQVHRFPPAHFDLVISRFGVMFFADPTAAFANTARALRPSGGLVLLVWQPRERNEWAVAVRNALTADTGPAPLPTRGCDPFSLGDPTSTRRLLVAAGFTDVDFTEVHEPVYYGPDSHAAYDAVLNLQEPRQLLDRLNGAQAELARKRLQELLATHTTDQGVLFDSRAWIVTARRA